jgi:type I restriction enzyme S subunit
MAPWKNTAVGEVVTLVSGGTPSRTDPQFWGGNIPWITCKDMKAPRLGDSSERLTEAGLEAGSRLIPAGSVLIVIRGMILAREVPVALATRPVAFNQDLKALLPKSEIDSEFLLYALKSKVRDLQQMTARAAHGTKSLTTSNIANLEIPFPPLHEQRQIARLLSAVQRAIERQERLIALTVELRKALMDHLFTHGTRGEPLKQTEIGPLPESWEIKRLANLLREPLRNGHSAKETTNPRGIRTLTLTAVTRADFSLANTKTTAAKAERVKSLWLHDGDVFIERANTLDYVGLAALYEGPDDFAIFPDLLVRIRLREDQLRPRVLAEYLIGPRCRQYFRMNAKGTAGSFPKIDQGIIENVQVPLPTPDEQSEIENAARTLERKHSLHVAMRKHYEGLFRTFLHQLMTAQIRIQDLDLSALGADAAEPAASDSVEVP